MARWRVRKFAKVGPIILVTIIGCATTVTPPSSDFSSPGSMIALKNKRDLYLKLAEKNLDKAKWPLDTTCDGLLFASLYAVAGGLADPLLAEDKDDPGKFHRHHTTRCYDERHPDGSRLSRSECSRDMYIGLLLWAWVDRDLGLVQRVIQHGRDNEGLGSLVWFMCRGRLGDIEFRPPIIGTAHELLFRLGGEDRPERIQLPLWSKSCAGFECHVQAIHLFIRASAMGELDPGAKEWLDWLVSRQDRNAFYLAIHYRLTGSKQSALAAGNVLLDIDLFPADRLPTSHERCEFYLWQREQYSKDWKPCPDQGRIHSGIDFLIAAAVLLGEIPQTMP